MISLHSSGSVPRSASLAVQCAYSAGNLGKSVVWNSFESIMLFFLVSMAGFDAVTAGLILAATLLWDAAFDMIVARWSDRRGNAQELARLIIVGAPLCGIGFWLIFILHAPWAIAAAIIVCRIGYSLCDVGHNTLLLRVARAPGDAARVSGLRLLFSASGVALLALVSGSSLSLAALEMQRRSLAAGALAGGLLYVATLLLALFATRRLSVSVDAPPRRGSPRPFSVFWRNPPFRYLLLLIAIQASFVPIFQRALPFYGQAVRADAGWAGPALLTLTLAQSLALPCWMAVARRWSSRAIAIMAYALAIIGMAGLTIASIGTAGTIMMILFGAGLAGMNLAIWALLTETVHRELTDGADGQATPVGLFLGVLKSAAALGNLLWAGVVALGSGSASGNASWSLLPLSATLLPLLGCCAALLVLLRNRT
ncbi:MFS transporter [uncultured Sphingomonas sp.]|uniref:MFS transporter n=1 Tax=uncultured Sphingomonas sp. TaxID=158754 RepID=UPI0030F4E93B